MAVTPRRPGLLLGATGLAMFAIDLDFFSLNLALPDMARSLGTTTTDLQWAISAPLLALGALLIPAGRLGDIFGRRPLFLLGATLFAVASLGCGLADSAGLLIAMRVLQGVGGAVLMPLTVAVVANAYGDPKARGRAIGLIYGIGAIGAAAGPFVGGLLTEHLGWEWVFFFNVPIAVGALLLGMAGVENSRDEHAPRRVDLPGLVLVASGIVAVSYAFDRAAAWGWDSTKFIGLLAGGIVLLVAFVMVEARVRNPLVDLALFRNRPFVVVTAAGMVANSAFVIAIFATTLYLQQVRDLSPVEAGLVFLAPSVALAFAGPLSGRLAEHLRPERIGALAVVVGALGLLIQTADITVWAVFLLGIAVMGLGYGIGWSYASVGTQAVVRPEQAGQASGVTLAIVIGGAGLFLVIAANAIEELSGGTAPTAGAIEDVLHAVAAASLVVGGVLVALGGRRRQQVAASTPSA
jgi:EmrB/QacA subfamily drug resistance transporter